MLLLNAVHTPIASHGKKSSDTGTIRSRSKTGHTDPRMIPAHQILPTILLDVSLGQELMKVAMVQI
jgi:hypothetical protein